MEWDTLRRIRRTLRRARRPRDWPLHRKLAAAVWLPVGVVAFAMLTGPYSSNAAVPPTPTTVETSQSGTTLPIGPPPAADIPHVVTSRQVAQEKALAAWVQAVPSKRTLPQQVAVEHFHTTRYHQILGLHTAATKAQRVSASGRKAK